MIVRNKVIFCGYQQMYGRTLSFFFAVVFFATAVKRLSSDVHLVD